jgi:hypothetical protein
VTSSVSNWVGSANTFPEMSTFAIVTEGLYLSGDAFLAGLYEVLYFLMPAYQWVVYYRIEKLFELGTALFDEFGVFVGLLPEVSFGELWEVELNRSYNTLRSVSLR